MMIERPDERQWQDLVRTYGTPMFLDRAWSMPERIWNIDAPTCSGEVILLIFNLAGSCIFVRRKGTSNWFFPKGRIEVGEDIIEAARRMAVEETGVKIEPVGVPLCQRITFSFSNLTLQRWHIMVVAETAARDLDPRNRDEIEEARLFDLPPPISNFTRFSWMHELHREALRYLRSLDAMDGI
jgi:8-oxo-dGTP pyrophosphatase MutT (NUDIX family)